MALPARAFSLCRASRGNQSEFRSKKVRASFSNCDQVRHFKFSGERVCSLAPPSAGLASPCGINSGGASEQTNASEFEKSLSWSGWADLNLPACRQATGLVVPKYLTKIGDTGFEPATSSSRTTRATSCANPRFWRDIQQRACLPAGRHYQLHYNPLT